MKEASADDAYLYHFLQIKIMLLEIKDLHASIGDKEILKGINLTIKPGEVHAIMGPNGAGRSEERRVGKEC